MEKVKEEVKSLTSSSGQATEKHQDDIRRLDAHYRDVCKAILLKDGVVVKDLTALAILQEYRRIWAKEDAVRKGKKARTAGSCSP